MGAIRIRFRLPTLLWLYAIAASALATFSSVEEYACAFVFLGAWLTLIAKAGGPSRFRFTPLEATALLAVFGVLAACCFPAVSRFYEAERVNHCRDRLGEIVRALQEYKTRHGVLPPTQVTNEDGARLSWRVELLPYLTIGALRSGHAGESDGPGYCCPNEFFSSARYGSSASYFAITGAGTAWDTLQSEGGEIGDDPAETLLLMEELDRGFDWKKPRDLSSSEAFRLLTQPVGGRYVHLSSGKSGYFERSDPNRGREGVNAAFADGRVRFLPLPLSEEFASALLTAHGGEEISASEMQALWRVAPDYGKIYTFSLFALLFLLPGARVFKSWPRAPRFTAKRLLRLRTRLTRGLDESKTRVEVLQASAEPVPRDCRSVCA